MALILNIETATEICSICISKGTDILAIKESRDAYSHAGQITLLINACLEAANYKLSDLEAVAVSSGPGSYTALRVGAATAKGICYALNKPLIAVDTLQSIALATYHKKKKQALYCPMIDARRMEVYSAFFAEKGEAENEPSAIVIDENAFSEQLAEGKIIICSGNGAEKCKAILKNPLISFEEVLCSSAHLVPLAQKAFDEKRFSDIAYFAPLYLKPPNITKAKKVL